MYFIFRIEALTLLLALLSVEFAKAEVSFRFGESFSGIVTSIDSSSLIYLEPDPNHSYVDDRSAIIRIWALPISPDELALIVLGRRLNCHVVYEFSNHIASDCVVEISKNGSSIDFLPSRSIRAVAEDLGIAVSSCSDEELAIPTSIIQHQIEFRCQP
jgi:hypothetical protein